MVGAVEDREVESEDGVEDRLGQVFGKGGQLGFGHDSDVDERPEEGLKGACEAAGLRVVVNDAGDEGDEDEAAPFG